MSRGTIALLVTSLSAALTDCGMSEGHVFCAPCPMPVAVEVNATADTGGPVSGLAIWVTGSASGSFTCSMGTTATTCYMGGSPGTYYLQVVAAGFQTTSRTVEVKGSWTPGPCPCPRVVTERLHLVLSNSP